MGNHAMLLEKHTAVRKGRLHDGKVTVMRSNLRWCSDGLEFTCWNGEVIRLAFIIDAFDREIIAWVAISGGGISGEMIRDMMLDCVERRFDAVFMDCQMPEMDGFTLTRNIKQDARFHGLPVVIHSSLSGSANEDHVRSVGADGYVAKFVAEDLADTIRRVLPK